MLQYVVNQAAFLRRVDRPFIAGALRGLNPQDRREKELVWAGCPTFQRGGRKPPRPVDISSNPERAGNGPEVTVIFGKRVRAACGSHEQTAPNGKLLTSRQG